MLSGIEVLRYGGLISSLVVGWAKAKGEDRLGLPTRFR